MRRPRQRRDPLTTPPECNRLATKQAELDLLDTIPAAAAVIEGWGIHHDSLEAVEVAARAIQRKARIARVVRVNRAAA